MAYTEKTQNYKLPQWQAGDKPSRQDYNEAFASVDAALANKVNIGTPQEYDLPLANGFVTQSQSTYYKDHSNIVSVHVDIKKTTGNFVNGETIINLPVGFRPRKAWPTIALYHGASGYKAIPVVFYTDGRIILDTGTAVTESNMLRFSFSFLAQ